MLANLRDRIGRVLYEEPGQRRGSWSGLSPERQAPWLADADRIMAVIAPALTAAEQTSKRAAELTAAYGFGCLEHRMYERLASANERLAANLAGSGVKDSLTTEAANHPGIPEGWKRQRPTR